MLLFKAWCETRSRFAIGVAVLGVLVVTAIGRGERGVWAAVYGDASATTFVLLAIVLGVGSLRQERALGTLGFSLTLPVTRGRLVAARAAVGVVEVWGLAGFVALAVAGVSALTGPGFPLGQALGFAALWGACGTLVLCLAQLLASLLASDYLAYLGTLLIVIGYEMIVQLTAMREQPLFDLYRLMSGGGEPYFRAVDATLIGLPWAALAVLAAGSAGLLVLAWLQARRLAL